MVAVRLASLSGNLRARRHMLGCSSPTQKWVLIIAMKELTPLDPILNTGLFGCSTFSHGVKGVD